MRGLTVLESLPFPSLPSGKAPATRKPPLQPKPVVLTTVPVPPRAGPTSAAVLLQPLVQQPAGEEAGEGPGSKLTAPEGPGPSVLMCEIGCGGPDITLSDILLLIFLVSPVVLIQGAIRVQSEGPAPAAAPRPERKSIVPAPMPGNSCPPEVDVCAGEGGQALTQEGREQSVLQAAAWRRGAVCRTEG